ncbi:xanthine dehydrogenase accessory protein XdhC [Mesorhizobium sp. M4A.F.Ca.ET.020.02.1.1]|uniref:xanthine dehydrogenase accessory protein XdhC n=1 Tax=unclassified Mesorhizobium TaxID=325217 RepID=UPI000FCCDFA5|nr:MULTISPECIES: xanthine dehydrogenase accessory protein XdhC [unclassified Mesorhizobium]RUX45980.1 xanthine dehydrogenase accessory protein XdhC [Mesorhizobium sp. M4A.F.Ca.ET.050.02.1.1]RVD42374.1 xanthine dehydrogenase accessory protein XdhC [Mesorhizobium sp. M4A.F.Ca.ET.020.02.1.1]RWC19464.1 MAG: xanthine dehydrogenase accessory protein XdhC [Mesorhizobium sp.]RWD24134.1 MAG: xanthine dehydrogenase accessory protein XdhC [Mesorhizobium sp.]RWD25768.1 MAG: xanthine dehydrogenase accessor
MNSKVQSLKDFLGQAGRAALVEVAATKGSTPRETGAFMLVSASAIYGTIGGGQLEYMAIDKARQMLGGRTPSRSATDEARIEVDEVCATLDVPLGPEIGQCCGGRVEVLIRPVDGALEQELIAKAEVEEAHLPYVYVFGGGHVGQALASALALLPIHAVVVETRAEALEGMPETVETRLTPMPEAIVREAHAGAAFAILTHDHALDFLIVAEALKRGDAAYVGMIGSRTKKATFKSWFLKSTDGSEAEFNRLVSPIGGNAVKDKRPPVIAALAAAEIMTALVSHATEATASSTSEKAMAD